MLNAPRTSPITSHQFTVTLDAISITITKKRIKNLIVSIDRDGAVKVSAPLRCSVEKIMTFLTGKQDWIKTHVDKAKQRPKVSPVAIQSGVLYQHLGNSYPFKVYEHLQKSSIHLDDQHIICYVKPQATEEDKQQLLVQWQRMQMRALLPHLISKWEPVIGVKVKEWRTRAMTSRWGSCQTRTHRICLNLCLIQKPLLCLEYVLVHEMVHLLEASHNRRFHQLMSGFMPEWKHYKQLLNRT